MLRIGLRISSLGKPSQSPYGSPSANSGAKMTKASLLAGESSCFYTPHGKLRTGDASYFGGGAGGAASGSGAPFGSNQNSSLFANLSHSRQYDAGRRLGA